MLADSADQEASKAAAGPTEDEELLMVARGEIPELDSEDELSQEAASVGSENEWKGLFSFISRWLGVVLAAMNLVYDSWSESDGENWPLAY